jgi:5-methylcytosine-specific restriction protein A
MCLICKEQSNRDTFAQVVDHIDPHKGSISKFLDESNLRSLCKECHDRVTALTEKFGQ